jgi:hypothetical protein
MGKPVRHLPQRARAIAASSALSAQSSAQLALFGNVGLEVGGRESSLKTGAGVLKKCCVVELERKSLKGRR